MPFPPAPLPRPEIPIVGQTHAVADWFITFNFICKCQPEGHLLLVAGRVGIQIQCPTCHKVYVCTGFRTNDQGALEMGWNVGLAREVAPN